MGRATHSKRVLLLKTKRQYSEVLSRSRYIAFSVAFASFILFVLLCEAVVAHHAVSCKIKFYLFQKESVDRDEGNSFDIHQFSVTQ